MSRAKYTYLVVHQTLGQPGTFDIIDSTWSSPTKARLRHNYIVADIRSRSEKLDRDSTMFVVVWRILRLEADTIPLDFPVDVTDQEDEE